MEQIKLAVIGDQAGIKDVFNSLKYPQLVGKVFYYDNEMLRTVGGDFLDGWDIIIVAFKESGYAEKLIPIIKLYINNPSVVILDYYKLRWASRPLMNVDVAMNNSYVDEYSGVILGISHGELAILPERLNMGDFANLAVSSQDIYYNLKSLEYCLDKYPAKIAHLKTAIIDLFDYSYFNYDASMTSKIMFYLSSGGYNMDQHNFAKNKDYKTEQYEDLVNKIRHIWKLDYSDDLISIWDTLFEADDLSKLYGSKYMSFNDISRRCDIVSDEQIERFKLGRYTYKWFDETISENKQYFERILEILNNINPAIKVYLVLIPRYAGVWEKEEHLLEFWKEPFYKILDEMSKKYSFEILDYVRNDFAKNRVYYQDEAHLNFLGAMKFTDMLLKDMLKDSVV